MIGFISDLSFRNRLHRAVDAAWDVFARKVGGGILAINKEASMQLQYAYVLKQLIPLTLHLTDERADVELETGVRNDASAHNIDALVCGTSSRHSVKIAIEMKCYRDQTASGKKRGAHDIFMKDVYEDLQTLEEYVANRHADVGIALLMTDLRRLVHPTAKRGKCWTYDISHGHTFAGGVLRQRIGGETVRVRLRNAYAFNWFSAGAFWFCRVDSAASQSP